MLGNPFYHGHIRKIVSAFGSLFNDIKVATVDGSGTVIKVSTVPIKYAGTDKTLLNDQPDRKPYSEIFPRMSFEVTGLAVDPERKLNSMGEIAGVPAPTPYLIDIGLYILSENQNDSLQIIEQILPYFSPTLTISMMNTPVSGMSQDVPITLTSVSLSDDYEGEEDKKRRVEWSMNFAVQANLFKEVPGDSYADSLVKFIDKHYDPSDPTSCTPPRKRIVKSKGNRIEKIYVNEYVDKFGFDRLWDDDPNNHSDVKPAGTIYVAADTFRR